MEAGGVGPRSVATGWRRLIIVRVTLICLYLECQKNEIIGKKENIFFRNSVRVVNTAQ